MFYYFGKVLLYHGSPDKSREKVSAYMGVSSYFLGEYLQAAKQFSLSKTKEIISLLREYDVKLKGVGNSASDGELMRELIFRILH
jgi:DNA polymerase-3 subunit delta